MKREEFRNAVRDKVRKIPLETRKSWREIDLLMWWQGAKNEDSYLTLDRSYGDVWQEVRAMCRDLFGDSASS
jgi:hypothetical protein